MGREQKGNESRCKETGQGNQDILYEEKKSIFNKVRVKNKAFVILAHKNTY